MLRLAGAGCWRVGFNAGDAVFWPDRASYIAHTEPPEVWPEAFARIVAERQITDIVLYGDTRPIHAVAVQRAQTLGLTVHVFEEGYLRPYWITYERGGSNGNSPLQQIDGAEIATMLAAEGEAQPEAPARWGDMRQHVFYGALYHFFVLALSRRYRGFRPHRNITVWREFRLHLRRLLSMPVLAAERRIAAARIGWDARPYHLVLLQLEHDASFRDHGPFATMPEFLEAVMAGFRDGAPRHHQLVFKAHPLEDGRVPLRGHIRRLARHYGLAGRVRYVPGGKLARLLDQARSAVTVNSTAAQQALWRGLPVKALGRAIYARPGLVSDRPLVAFFAGPDLPDMAAYRDFRRFLLETSQVPGGFYSAHGRRAALRHVADMMLAAEDPYAALRHKRPLPRRQLHVVVRVNE